MPRDSQGRPAHSFGHARRQDESFQQHQTKVIDPKSRPSGHQPDPDAEMKDESPEDIRDVVQEHGPAVEMHHEHDGETHHVTTHHGEHRQGKEDGMGFTHHSKHPTHRAAHAHMGLALGLNEHERSESPEEEGVEEGKMSSPIPGMA